MEATFCDFCGNQITGDRVWVTRQAMRAPDPDADPRPVRPPDLVPAAGPVVSHYHPECTDALLALIEGDKPTQPELPSSEPNIPTVNHRS